MAFDYTEIQGVAETLITEFGRSVTLEKFNETLQDAGKPYLGSADPRSSPLATVTISAAVVEPDSTVQLGIATKDSELVKRSEQVMIIAPGVSLAEDLATFDEVVDGSTRWKIQVVETLKPGPVILLYFVGVAR